MSPGIRTELKGWDATESGNDPGTDQTTAGKGTAQRLTKEPGGAPIGSR
jgi:hypothetical protein